MHKKCDFYPINFKKHVIRQAKQVIRQEFVTNAMKYAIRLSVIFICK